MRMVVRDPGVNKMAFLSNMRNLFKIRRIIQTISSIEILMNLKLFTMVITRQTMVFIILLG